VVTALDVVIPSAFFLVREPALSGAEGNLLFQRGTTKAINLAASWLRPLLYAAVLYIVCMQRASRPKSKSTSHRNSKSRHDPRPKVKVFSSKTVYQGPVFWVTADEVQEPGGVQARRDIIHHTGSIVVLAVENGKNPRIVLERQYRHAAKDYLWELPAGRIDPGEKPLPAAKRELLEETGYTAKHWRCILKFYASPGFVAETMAIYLATGLRAGTAQPEADEVIEIRMVPLATAVRMVMNGKIHDAKTIAGVLWLNHQVEHKADL
jgi:ADP-ribose pyrophosphatase